MPPHIADPTPTPTANTTKSTTIASPLEDSLLFITGGSSSNSFLPSTEVYPKTTGCSPPPLPLGRYDHNTIVTSEPSAMVATCGGATQEGSSASCLVFDPINQRWDESRMGNMTMAREGAAVTLNDIGVFILGGADVNYLSTSEFLAAGSMQWQEGPALPVRMRNPCAIPISPTSFLTIYGAEIWEFDTAMAGPTSREGWREAGYWPSLKTRRTQQPGCAKIGQKVIIAGGHNNGASLSSTEVLNLIDRRI